MAFDFADVTGNFVLENSSPFVASVHWRLLFKRYIKKVNVTVPITISKFVSLKPSKSINIELIKVKTTAHIWR